MGMLQKTASQSLPRFIVNTLEECKPQYWSEVAALMKFGECQRVDSSENLSL